MSQDDGLQFEIPSDAPSFDDPAWDRPAVLHLEDGRSVILPDVSVREAMSVLATAAELGELLGGRIDPKQVTGISAATAVAMSDAGSAAAPDDAGRRATARLVAESSKTSGPIWVSTDAPRAGGDCGDDPR